MSSSGRSAGIVNDIGMIEMVNVIKFDRVEIRRPFFDPNPHKTTTENHEWRQGMFVVFKDRYGRELWYMPRWGEITEINKKKEEVEEINRKLCREANE